MLQDVAELVTWTEEEWVLGDWGWRSCIFFRVFSVEAAGIPSSGLDGWSGEVEGAGNATLKTSCETSAVGRLLSQAASFRSFAAILLDGRVVTWGPAAP